LTILGAYGANNPGDIEAFESLLGREVDAVHAVVGGANWWDFTQSASWLANSLWSQVDKPVLWSVPMLVWNGAPTLAQAAAGDFNDHYTSVAKSLLQSRSDDSGPIYIRAGWEFNLDGFPWKANGMEGDFIGAYREFVDTFRDVSDRFKFEWNTNVSWGPMDPSKAYPGDAYVDVVGMDFYWSPQYQGNDPIAAWNELVNEPYGLKWLEDFAAAHGKPTAYSEWGIQTDNAGPFIAKVDEWFDSHNVVYQSYWNSSADGIGKLTDNHLPNAAAAFAQAFGDPSSSTPVTPPATTPVAPPTAGSPEGHGGNDTYVVDSVNDKVVEGANGGTDTVTTWVNGYVLPANVENLALTGSGWIPGTGNGLENTIKGNDSANLLNGKGGTDILTGGGGNDTFVVAKGEGNDTITDFHAGWGAGDVLRLEGFASTSFEALKAGSHQSGGNTVLELDGGQSVTLLNVQLSSLVSDDVQFVGATGGGATPVPPATSPVESPALGGSTSWPVSGTPTNFIYGHAWDDSLSGTSNNDRIASIGGKDWMAGGLGDDTYVIYSGSEQISEKANEGTDTVVTFAGQYTLPANIENLDITGTSWTKGTGNSLNNIITGNSGVNVLNGSSGNDRLTGGAGHDTFVIGKGAGTDTVTDFTPHDRGGDFDTLQLEGFGSGARLWTSGNLVSVQDTDGSVTQFTLNGVTSLATQDYHFG
jgi:Ca2+-binding RTX toxin-like protein